MNPYHDEKGRFSSKDTLFISGSSHTETKGDLYYRRKLPKDVRKEIKSSMKARDKIIVGDAPGIDRQVQRYLKSKHYKNVEIYGPGSKVRYSANKKWKTNPIDSGKHAPGSKQWLAEKDAAMIKASTKALAVVIENGGSDVTRRNVKKIISQHKNVKVYELSKKGDKWTNII